jgi:hypothetical protein
LAFYDFGGFGMPNDPFDEFPFDAEAIAAALAHAAMADGDASSVTALAVSTPGLGVTGYRDYNGHSRLSYDDFFTRLLTLYLEVPAASSGQFNKCATTFKRVSSLCSSQSLIHTHTTKRQVSVTYLRQKHRQTGTSKC